MCTWKTRKNWVRKWLLFMCTILFRLYHSQEALGQLNPVPIKEEERGQNQQTFIHEIFFKSTCIFLGKGAASSISCLNRPLKASFLWPHHSCMQTWIELENTYKPPQGPKVFSKAPFVTFEQPNWKAIGNNHMVSGSVFFVSSYILVLRLKINCQK